jgi:hypothetical protein
MKNFDHLSDVIQIVAIALSTAVVMLLIAS